MRSYKALIVIFVIGIAGVLSVYLFEKRSSEQTIEYKNPLHSEKVQAFFKKRILRLSEADSANSAAPSQMDEVKALVEQAQSEYMDIVAITGHRGIQSLSYEDDWCDDFVDLREEEYEYAKLQQRDFEARRNSNIPVSQDAGFDITFGIDVPRELKEQLSSTSLYSEMTPEELVRLAKSDDVYALAELLSLARSDKVSSSTQFWAAQQLLFLGNVDAGLVHVVSVYLAHSSVSNNKEYKKKNFMHALEMAEYGLMRKSTAGVMTLISTVFDESGSPEEGFNFLAEISSEEWKAIKSRAKNRYEVINDLRLNENYAPLADMDEGRERDDIYNEELYFLYRNSGEKLTSPYIPEHWKRSYLFKNACVERKLASHHFRINRLPDLSDQIRALLEEAEADTAPDAYQE